jgi:platelet-activating factor acetylhydrolase IB subunit alpha
MPQTGHENWVRDVKAHPNGKWILSVGDDRSLRVWDPQNQRCVKTLPAHAAFVSSVAVHPSRAVVATGSNDSTAKLWDCR